MPSSFCCVPFCVTGYRSTRRENRKKNQPNPSLFSMPQIFSAYGKGKSTEKTVNLDKVCALHFQEEFVERNYRKLLMPDGTFFEMERGNVMLKKNAVPSIFPEYPSYKSKLIPPPRKPPKRRYVDPNMNDPSSTKRAKKDCGSHISVPLEDDSINNEVENEVKMCNSETSERLSFDDLRTVLQSRSLLKWEVHVNHRARSILFFQQSDSFEMEKHIVITESLNVHVFICNKSIQLTHKTILNEADLNNLLKSVHHIQACPGNSPTCRGYLSAKCKKCEHCNRFDRRNRSNVGDKYALLMKKKEFFRKKYLYLLQKVNVRNFPKQSIDKAIECLPTEQKECIQAMLNAAKHPRDTPSAKGVRYSKAWMYQCVLLKIRNYKLYRNLQFGRIIPLPSRSTIHKYIRKLKPSFGFQMPLLNVLKEKAKGMSAESRRGALLIDEMKISPRATFDRSSMKLAGFTDLGKYTPQKDRDKLGDHALVLLFQPFQGHWFQAVGSFLSRGCATGNVLAQIVLEAVALLENSGIFVDCIVSDGAQWNRGMWTEFGVNEKNPSCEHFCDETRQLYFVSDFPHLIKNLWTWTLSHYEIQTPDGLISRRYWDSLIKIEAQKSIKACPELNSSHIYPKVAEKISVSRAYQFFSLRVASAIRFYRSQGYKELEGSENTEKFIIRIANLIHAFDSRTGKSAIRKHETPEKNAIKEFLIYLEEHLASKEIARPKKKRNVQNVAPKKTVVSKKKVKKVVAGKKAPKKNTVSAETDSSTKASSATVQDKDISAFNIPDDVIILEDSTLALVPQELGKMPSVENLSTPVEKVLCNRIASSSTLVGLQVTCQAALKLSDFLLNTCGYTFVMLTRFNQDNIEKFFGMIRNSGGCNDHPDPTAFVLTFRLMSMYSLVKPNGSNVTGEELFESLLKDCHTSSSTNDKLDEWKELRTRIITNVEQSCYPDCNSGDINITTATTEEDVRLLEFLGGYVAMKAISRERCETCTNTLIRTNANDFNCNNNVLSTTSLLDMRNYHNVLHYPSESLFKLIREIETYIDGEITCKNVSSLSPDTFPKIVDALGNAEFPHIGEIGCNEHRVDLLSYIVQFFLILRMQFICKQYNNSIKNIGKAKELRKMGKLIQGNK